MDYNFPTILTLMRIVLIPVFVVFFYLPVDWSYLAAAIIFAVACFTDWFDGYLARKWQQTSAFGAFLDPVADKLIVVIALVMLVDRNPTNFPDLLLVIPATVVIGREIVISALREWMATFGESAQVSVSMIGKVKTFAQMVALEFLLYKNPIGIFPIAEIGFFLLYFSAILTLWYMYVYLKAAWPILKSQK